MGGRFKLKRKQIYAILLAGVIAVGSTPSAVMAAEATSAAAETAAETENVQTGEESGQAASETPAAPVEPPAETQPEATAPTENTTETPAPAETEGESAGSSESLDPSPSPETQPEGEATETPAPGEGEAGEETGEQTPAEDTGISITTTAEDGTETVNYYNTLQEALDAVTTTGEASEATVINITKEIHLSATHVISGKKVCITGASAQAKIARDAGLTGDIFSVTGEGSELQFAVSEGGALTVDGSGVEGVTGSLVNVGEGAAFGMSAGVTLTGNTTTAQGGAITNNGGNIVLKGGTVTGNTGANGAVYTNNDIMIQGTVSVSGNTGANLYLDGTAAAVVTGAMTGSTISLTSGSPADELVVIKAGSDEAGTQIGEEDFKTAVTQFTYDTEDYTINLGVDVLTAVLTATAEEPEEPVEPEKQSFLKPDSLTNKNITWYSRSSARVALSTLVPCEWYYVNVNAADIKSNEDVLKLYNPNRENMMSAKNSFNVDIEGIADGQYTIVFAKSTENGNYDWKILNLAASSSRPSPSPTPGPSVTTRAPYTHSVNESTVTGLETPLKFYPNTFYEFHVTGAGQNDKGPYVAGDERWVPAYWSTASDGSSPQSSWRIGSAGGITQAVTYNMYIFLKKYQYNGSDWVDTGIVESITVQFRSAEITQEEMEELGITPAGSSGTDYGTGTYSAELTATAAAEYRDGEYGTSRTAVDTADNSPVGTMSALAVLSLAAGGYILVRKRKKDA